MVPVISRAIENTGKIFEPNKGKEQSILSIIAASVAFSALVGFIENENIFILIALFVVSVVYLIFFVFGVPFPSYDRIKKIWSSSK